jgi:phosphoribosylformimino-5-aminoimidazole carboxamide ribonucleotide (ProFAR) isomerase
LKVANEATPTLDGIIIGRALYEGTIDVSEAVAAAK